jgi:hypothetical protein
MLGDIWILDIHQYSGSHSDGVSFFEQRSSEQATAAITHAHL